MFDSVQSNLAKTLVTVRISGNFFSYCIFQFVFNFFKKLKIF